MGIANTIKGMSVQKAAIVGGGIALFYYLLLYDNGSAIQSRITSTESQLSTAQSEIKGLEGAVEDAKRLVLLAEDLGERVDKVLKYLPEQLTDADVVKSISVAARLAGVRIVNISSQTKDRAQGGDFYQELPVFVELVGSYGQIMVFLSQLTKEERIYSIRGMDFGLDKVDRQKSSDASLIEVRFSTVVIGYRYRGDQSEVEQ